MLSFVSPGDVASAKHNVSGVQNPAAVLTDQHRRCSLQCTRSNDELPVLRAQYVARGVRVLFGSRWRLNRFQERTIVLRTGAKPVLTVDDTEDTFDLTLSTSCELTGSTGIELTAAAFRVRIRFSTPADAKIWRSLILEALAHAKWRRDTRPVKSKFRGVRVVKHVNSSQKFIVKKLTTSNEQGSCLAVQVLRRLYSSWGKELVRGYRVVETEQETLLIMPQLPGVTLLQFLRQRRHNGKKLRENEAWRVLNALAIQLQTVHRSGVIHCDLNLENVLVAQDLSSVWLIDFDGAYDVLGEDWQMTGTPGFVAPERVQYPLQAPTAKADVFSLGILLFQALTGQHPYIGANKPLQLSDSLKLDLSLAERVLTDHCVAPEVRKLIQEMLHVDPQARVSMDKVLATTRREN
ncbi:putative serine/threonine-protein kinase 2 [Phytophthora citrophthora]|uniref:Serine/threonine-protein kinase 2 n=1 Tax=Phytophthora citrophthora TaxID=4793 RepID=A0AAD9GX37_9STRA|nr:putative serine/threonine-protein kinase 2 [Phytophthora citrophthora]